MSITVFVIIFLSLFGPKVAGVVDLSLLGGIVGLFVMMFLKKVIVGREYVLVIMLVAAVAFYSILVVSVNNMEDIQPILRIFRALASTTLLGLVFYNLSTNGVLSPIKIINVLIAVLLVNAVVVVVSIIMPDIKAYLAELYGFDKRFVDLRSFGLTAGYDTAGYLCVIGAILSFIGAYYRAAVRYSLIGLVFVAATVFTSRSSMLLAIILMAGVCAVYILNGRWSLKVISLGYIAVGVSVAIYYVAPLILLTFELGILQESNIDYTSNYAETDLSSWYEAMWALPEDPVSVLFGTGKNVETSDVGYVKLIYMIGVVGLLLVNLIYVYMFYVVKVLNHLAKSGTIQMDIGGRILAHSLMAIIFLMFIVNIKNLYFLTRGYHELIVIMFFFVVGLTKRRLPERCYSYNIMEKHDRI